MRGGSIGEVTIRCRDHVNFTADKIVTWRFLRNRRLILRLHTIFRALIYWAHRAVIFAIA